MTESKQNVHKDKNSKINKRYKTPTVLQMESVECGAAALGIILAYYDRIVPLEELRLECGVSRDGSKASNMMKAARHYGLVAQGYRKEPQDLKTITGPCIVHWNFNHFLVLEGFKKGRVYLNDPGTGPRTVSEEEFDEAFTGIVLMFEPGPEFVRGGSFPGVLPALRTYLKGSRAALTYIIMVSLALVVPGLLIPGFARIFVDNILLGSVNNWVVPVLTGMLLTALFRGLLTWIQQYYLVRLETKLALSIASKFFWHILHLPMEFFAQRWAGEISNRILISDRVAELLSGRLATSVLDLLTIVFYFVLMLRYNVMLSIIGLIIAMLNMAFLKYIARLRTDQNQKLLQDTGKLAGISMQGLQIIESLKSTGSESDFFAKWGGYYAKAVNAQRDMQVSTQLLVLIPTFLSAVNTAVILTVGGMEVINQQLTVGMLVAFQSLMASFLAPVNNLVNLGGTIQDIKGDLKRLDDVFNYPISNNMVENDDSLKLAISPKLSGNIEIKELTFGYNRLEPPLIENFNLQVPPGSRVALVGGSGSGKSTVAKLLAGIFDPQSGEILLDGLPRQELPRQVINNSVALVDQDISMFSGTIRDNLTLWDPTISDNDLIQAAKDACIHEDITSREGGYDNLLQESGRNYSGGQRQRLEIARALAANPSIIILDEATSALDPMTEKQIDDNIRRRGCTSIIIAHRLSTIRDCDEILVLDRGKIVQRGTHEEMKTLDSHYARLIAVM